MSANSPLTNISQNLLNEEEQAEYDALVEELPRAFWKRYRALIKLSDSGAITEEERAEFLAKIEQTEVWNVKRLELLEVFAQRRGIHFPELMQLLAIRHHPYA
jgi:hypothetical protein